MTYRIEGLDPASFADLIGHSCDFLAARHVVRMTADTRPGYPCRVSLDDVELDETLLLLNHVSHDGANPYRASHAIFVGERSVRARYIDQIPPALDRRVLSLRAFGDDGMMRDAALTQPGQADATVLRLLADPLIDHVDAHNATRGCFAGRFDRG